MARPVSLMLALLLAACATVGPDFSFKDAQRIKLRMTEAQVATDHGQTDQQEHRRHRRAVDVDLCHIDHRQPTELQELCGQDKERRGDLHPTVRPKGIVFYGIIANYFKNAPISPNSNLQRTIRIPCLFLTNHDPNSVKLSTGTPGRTVVSNFDGKRDPVASLVC